MTTIQNLTTNNILNGGIILVLGGIILRYLSSYGSIIFRWISHHALNTVSIHSCDSGFHALKIFISKRANSRYCNLFTAGYDQDRNPRCTYMPIGLGTFKFQGRRIIVWQTFEKMETIHEYRSIIRMQTWFGNKEIFTDLMTQACKDLRTKDRIDVIVSSGSVWAFSHSKPFRSSDSVVLPGNTCGDIIQDLSIFIQSKEKYQKLGIPYKRGYLFHGPPGNGKSSMVHVMASVLQKSIYVLNLGGFQSNELLVSAFTNISDPNIIILIEDIDIAFGGRSTTNSNNGVDFAGLLNILDGVYSKEGQIVVMTTNHYDRLDPALVRYGRADFTYEFKNATPEQAAEMYKRFFPLANNERSGEFGETFKGESMSKIQEVLMSNSAKIFPRIMKAA